MPSTLFEPAIPGRERPQTQALERAANGTDIFLFSTQKLAKIRYFHFCIFCVYYYYYYYNYYYNKYR
jgi:hypothetical protein